MHQADGSIGLRYPRPVAQPSSPGRRNKVRAATWNPVTCTHFGTGKRRDEMRLSCAPLYWYVHTRNPNGSRHEHCATSLETDDFHGLAAIGTFKSWYWLTVFPRPGPQLALFGKVSCMIAACVLPYGLFKKRGDVCACSIYLVERSPLWPIVIRKLL